MISNTHDRRARAFLRQEEGSVIIETALMLVVLLLLAFGIMDMGRALYIENSLAAATREGARFAAVQTTVSTSAIQDTVRKRFNTYVFGSDTLRSDSVTVTLVTSAGATTSIKVKVGYGFKWLTAFPKLLGMTTTTGNHTAFHAQSEYKYEF